MEGLTASIGGLDASLATTASAALVDVLSCDPGSGADDEAAPQLLVEVTGCLLEIWGRHARCNFHK